MKKKKRRIEIEKKEDNKECERGLEKEIIERKEKVVRDRSKIEDRSNKKEGRMKGEKRGLKEGER